MALFHIRFVSIFNAIKKHKNILSVIKLCVWVKVQESVYDRCFNSFALGIKKEFFNHKMWFKCNENKNIKQIVRV